MTAIAVLPVSAVIATRDRQDSLSRMLSSMAERGTLPRELVLVDASADSEATRELLGQWAARTENRCPVNYQTATQRGAATQRKEGVAMATESFIWFMDDDIVFQSDCACALFQALQTDSRLGGANAMIENQRYQKPGRVSRAIFTLMHGRAETSFAGRLIGPAVNLLPEDRDDLPEVVPVEWLNTTCTMYRREALPDPPFDSFFNGYSLMEDLALSLKVSQRGWKLANVRTARIFHNSQGSSEKGNNAKMAAMDLRNRHYVMTQVLGRDGASDYLRLVVWELFSLVTSSRSLRKFYQALLGKLHGVQEIRRAVKIR